MSTQALKAAATGANQQQKPASFPAMVETLKKQVALALPKHMNPDRMARIALTEFRKNRNLSECKPESIFASVVIASQIGLEPGINGQGYLIPYKGTCTFVPGWKGLVDLAQRSGRSSVWTGAVFEGDEFEYEKGTKPYIRHKEIGENDPKKLTHVYAVGWVRGAEYPVLEVWPVAKVWKHRDRFNKMGTSHYSYNHPEMYARKVVLLQVLKYMPQSIELAMAMDLDGAAEVGRQNIDLGDAIEGTFVPTSAEEGDQAGASQDGGDAITLVAFKDLARAVKSQDSLDALWQSHGRHFTGNDSLEAEAFLNVRRDQLAEGAAK